VVEDHPPLRGLIAEALQAAGYLVVEAWNGQQAIAALDEHLPPLGTLCLVLLDLRLPYVSGMDVLGHLAARGAFVPVIAMSADSGLLDNAAASGAQGILQKPFELDDLLVAVRRYCPVAGQAAFGDQAC
jgi:CheY-like chemotaxis protein